MGNLTAEEFKRIKNAIFDLLSKQDTLSQAQKCVDLAQVEFEKTSQALSNAMDVRDARASELNAETENFLAMLE